jgi:acetyl esterase/lipase
MVSPRWPNKGHDLWLRKLPKTYIAITEYDSLRDEGLIYAERLKRLIGSGSVELKYWTGLEHGLYNFYHYK